MAESTCLCSAPPVALPLLLPPCPEPHDPILIPSPHRDLSPPRLLPPFLLKTRPFPFSSSRWKRGGCSCNSGFCCGKRARSRETRAGETSQPRTGQFSLECPSRGGCSLHLTLSWEPVGGSASESTRLFASSARGCAAQHRAAEPKIVL